VLIKSVEVVHG